MTDNPEEHYAALAALEWVQRGCCTWSATCDDGRMYVIARAPVASAGWLLLLFADDTANGEPLLKEWHCTLEAGVHAARVLETAEQIWQHQ